MFFADLNMRTAVRVEKPWGYELMWRGDDAIAKMLYVRAGESTSVQYHVRKREISMPVEIGPGGHRVIDGSVDDTMTARTIEPGVVHSTVGPIVVFEITTPENDDVVRIEDRYGR